VPLTPADVANKQFKIAFRGYSLDEVDSFLDEVEGELGRLLRENNDLKTGRPAPVPFSEPVAAVPPPTAPIAPGEGQEAALRTLLLAQRTADEVVAEARAEAAKIVGEAQSRAAGVDAEIAARISAAMGGLDQRKRELEVQIEDLRSFEREYRTRLKAYLEGQLRDLSTRGAPDDGGAGVPAAARTAAVGLGPAPGSVAPPPAAPSQPPAAPPAAMSQPPAAPPSYRPAEPPVPPPTAPSFSPAPSPAPGPTGLSAPPAPPAAPPAPSAAPPGPPAFTPAPPPAPAGPPAGEIPSVEPDGPPAGPPREADGPTLRAVPPLQTSAGPEPIGPFTIVPPSVFSEQLDDGPEPPAER
jgi:DivIVA domain-containing protein